MKLRRDILTRKLTKAFAENGSKIEIPLDIQPSGSVSFNEGFGGLYSKPVKPQSEREQAGLQIKRENINWLFNAITSDIIQNSDDLGALEDEVSGLITSLNTKTPKLLTENLTWTVGSGEESDTHFNTLQNALNKACYYQNINNIRIDIKLKSDYVFNENIYLNYVDLSFVEITSSDSEVSVSSSLIGSLFSISYATFPFFNIKLNLSQNLSLNSIFTMTYSKIYFKGANSGILNSKCSIFTGWGNYIITAGAIFTGCSGESVFKVYFSNINSEAADFSNFTGSILASSVTNSKINLTASKYTNCNPSTYLLSVGYHGLIISYENEKTGLQGTATNITPNQWNAGGVILYF